MKAVLVIPTAFIFAFMAGCGDGATINGLYRSEATFSISQDKNVYLAIVGEQFGHEVGGLVRLYEDKDLTIPFQEDDPICGCMPIEGGEVDGGVFRFQFHMKGTCIKEGLDETIVITGNGFDTGEDVMKGLLKCVSDSGGCWKDKWSISLRKIKKLKELQQRYKVCQQD
jgi:hypothetical protein